MLPRVTRIVIFILAFYSWTLTSMAQDGNTTHQYAASDTDAYNPLTSMDVAVKTNGLYDALAVPNLGIEVAFGRKWTVGLDWMYAWWKTDRRHRYWQCYGGYLTVRRYFKGHAQLSSPSDKLFTGHHIGAYVLGLTYDFEWGKRGYQAEKFGFGAGLEYGYAVPIGKRLNLDFSLGVGFQDGEYKEYVPQDTHYVWQATRKRHWIGPTKAEISLVWIIWSDNLRAIRKGGER